MSDESAMSSAGRTHSRNIFQNRLRGAVLSRLGELRQGRLVLIEGTQRHVFGNADEDALEVTVEVLDSRFFGRLFWGGSLGAADAYIRGFWICRNLVDLVRIFCRNADVLSAMERRSARFLSFLRSVAHRMRRNTIAGSRRNIAAHYDLGNDFFSIFLDETLSYSCAIFPGSESSLYEASVAKFDRICQKLELHPEDEVLEIGSGWGGFALHAAKKYGCRITATTISTKQYEFTKKCVERAGLGDRICVLMQDYRQLQGAYDKIVSIEMIEAVGYQYFDTFFTKCSGLLKPAGRMLLQAIVFPDQQYNRYRKSVDFIQEYVFPGGCLPSIGAICRSIGKSSRFRVCHLEDITPHYARTLAHWRQRFLERAEQVRNLGFSEEFLRTWQYYFCYCEGGFRERAIGDVQILLTRL